MRNNYSAVLRVISRIRSTVVLWNMFVWKSCSGPGLMLPTAIPVLSRLRQRWRVPDQLGIPCQSQSNREFFSSFLLYIFVQLSVPTCVDLHDINHYFFLDSNPLLSPFMLFLVLLEDIIMFELSCWHHYLAWHEWCSTENIKYGFLRV